MLLAIIAALAVCVLCNSEIITLVTLGIFGVIFAGKLIAAWAKEEEKSLPGTFTADWGKK